VVADPHHDLWAVSADSDGAHREVEVPLSRRAGVEVRGLDPRMAALVDRYVTAEKLAEDVDALGVADHPEQVIHGYLIAAVQLIGEAHADCRLTGCATCRELGRVLSMVVAENHVRHDSYAGRSDRRYPAG
jgi:hypothetical protein